MIIQIRGTSGSGKSTAMNRFMDMAHWQGVYRDGRKKPIYYYSVEPGMPLTLILGHYESPCGGCDTIGSARAVYDVIKEVYTENVEHVICEGLLLSEDVKWTKQLAEEGAEVRCIFLTTPVEKCLEQIKTRRAGVGNDKPLSPDNTVNRVKTIDRAKAKLKGSVYCRSANADQVPELLRRWILRG